MFKRSIQKETKCEDKYAEVWTAGVGCGSSLVRALLLVPGGQYRANGLAQGTTAAIWKIFVHIPIVQQHYTSVKRYQSSGKRVAAPPPPHIYGNFQPPPLLHCCRLPDELLGWSPSQIWSYACLPPSPQQCSREPLPLPDVQISIWEY